MIIRGDQLGVDAGGSQLRLHDDCAARERCARRRGQNANGLAVVVCLFQIFLRKIQILQMCVFLTGRRCTTLRSPPA